MAGSPRTLETGCHLNVALESIACNQFGVYDIGFMLLRRGKANDE